MGSSWLLDSRSPVVYPITNQPIPIPPWFEIWQDTSLGSRFWYDNSFVKKNWDLKEDSDSKFILRQPGSRYTVARIHGELNLHWPDQAFRFCEKRGKKRMPDTYIWQLYILHIALSTLTHPGPVLASGLKPCFGGQVYKIWSMIGRILKWIPAKLRALQLSRY